MFDFVFELLKLFLKNSQKTTSIKTATLLVQGENGKSFDCPLIGLEQLLAKKY